jgi:hypothetical protein
MHIFNWIPPAGLVSSRLFSPYRDDSVLAREPPPSGFSMSKSKNNELRFFKHVEKTEMMLEVHAPLLIERLRQKFYEHSEKARAPHTNGPRDVPRCGALSLLQKTLHYKGG